jgi:acyl-CoA synthetase (AMP-forming)/AMP-acid ligase II
MLERFLALAAAAPEAAALIYGATGEVTTRAQLARRIDEIAARFAGAGFRSGEVVAIQLPNSVDFLAAFGAILKQRLVAILIDRDATETEVANVLGHFAARGLSGRGSGLSLKCRRCPVAVATPLNPL